MNTVRSVGYGWGVLMAAGAGAYILAKRSINADKEVRKERTREAELEHARFRALELQSYPTLKSANAGVGRNIATAIVGSSETTDYGSASDPAPADEDDSSKPEHADSVAPPSAPNSGTIPDIDDDPSPYQQKEVFRSLKGDRLTGFSRNA